MKKILIVVLLCGGCISNDEFWHPDNRVRVKPTVQFEYTTPEQDAIRYYLLERIHAYQRATTSVVPSLPTKPLIAGDERGALLNGTNP